MSDLKEGLYDQLITRRIRRSLDGLYSTHLRPLIAELEENNSPDYLARHLVRQIKLALQGLPAEGRKLAQIRLANSLLEFAKAEEPESVDKAGEILRAIYRGTEPPQPPTTPLGASNLIMNAKGEPRLSFELEREITSADRVLSLHTAAFRRPC